MLYEQIELQETVRENLKLRVLSGRILSEELAQIPRKLLCEILTACGCKLEETTGELDIFMQAQLIVLAHKSSDPLILSGLAVNPEQDISKVAAQNHKTPVAAIAAMMNNIPKDERSEFTIQVGYDSNYETVSTAYGYFDKSLTLAWEIIESHHPEKAVLIMAELRKVNAELAEAMVRDDGLLSKI